MSSQKRHQLHDLLVSVLGSSNVYYQPPPDARMEYPCIVYKWDHSNTQFADNTPYRRAKRWQITHIDRDPDSDVPDKIAELPMCMHHRTFATRSLNHTVFDMFF